MPYSLLILPVETIEPEILKIAFIEEQSQKTYFLHNIEHRNHASDSKSSNSNARQIQT